MLLGAKLPLHSRDEDYALALVDGAFTKAIVVQLVRKVEGKQFFEVCSFPVPSPRPHLGASPVCLPLNSPMS